MNPWALTACLVSGSYLLGSVPFGLIVGLIKGTDVRGHGSKNIGATNVGRLLGRRWGFLVFFLDLAKGLAPTLVAGSLVMSRVGPTATGYLMWLLVGAAAVLGHNFPVYLRFKGGKGVATSLGMVLGLYPYFTWAGLIALLIWIICLLLSRYVSLASMVAAVSMPLAYVLLAIRNNWDPFGSQWPLTGLSVVLAGLIVFRHRANLGRLRAGTENRIGRIV